MYSVAPPSAVGSECQIYSHLAKIVSEFDQEIPQSQTADKPMAPRGRATQPQQDTKVLLENLIRAC